MHAPLHALAQSWLAAGRKAVLVCVDSVEGSAPCELGRRMLVAADEIAGTIGGGHLELQAIARARAALAEEVLLPQPESFALGPALGQCCGGRVRLRWQRLDADLLAAWPPPAPRLLLQLHGAGHVGRAVVALLERLPCQVQWIDERDDAFPATPAVPHIARLSVDVPEAEVINAPAGAHLLVMTHSHDLDLRIVEQALQRSDLGSVGLIGSASKRARFEHRLLARGLAPERVAALQCPIGIEGIAGKQPEVIAVSVVAELLRRSS